MKNIFSSGTNILALTIATITSDINNIATLPGNKIWDILKTITKLGNKITVDHKNVDGKEDNRIPIVEFLQQQANESLLHAQQAGELITGLDGHPSQKIAKIKESNRHSIQDILNESLEHEVHALNLYKKLLACVEDASVYLEEYTRGMIGQEEQHSLELGQKLFL